MSFARFVSSPRLRMAIGGVAVIGAGGFAFQKVQAARTKAAFLRDVEQLSKGVVHIYTPGRWFKGTPTPGAHMTKLEAFCRVHKVPYHMHFRMDVAEVSPTETGPFIAMDGELIGESQFCIDAIKRRFNLVDDEGLTPEQRAVFTATRRLIEWSFVPHMYRTTFIDNHPVMAEYFGSAVSEHAGFPKMAVKLFLRRVRSNLIDKFNASGIGWHTDERYVIEATRDATALGDLVRAADARGHKWIFGSDKPTSVDCFVYGLVAQYRALPAMTTNTGALEVVRTDPALVAFAKRFEDAYFPDLNNITPYLGTLQKFD